MGGRVTLIKSVLSSIPIYFLSCFHCLKTVLRRIERIQRDFLWNDSIEKKKYHLVEWENVCKPLSQGGLGSKLLFVNISWLMVVGVFHSKLIGFLVYGSLFYVFRWSFLSGFDIGSMMVFRSNFGMMNGADNWCFLINSQILFCWIVDNKDLLLTIFL